MTRLKKKVLIAENKQFLVDVIRESLSSEGYDCVCVNTENELYGVIDNVDAAVVGLDICPGDQPRRVDMIAEIKHRFGLPLLALTSLQYSSVRIELLKKGADDVLTKPFNPDELAVRLGKIMERNAR
ncbi:MAG: response regulator [Rikenellaceae bacterium]|nr:response regulator [Rikenellaceae bacterium]MCI6318166.1 response regulator [Rikenellaceae bacterium]MDY3893746.1 response regulator [Candidatus Cryptobacteroides sp.]